MQIATFSGFLMAEVDRRDACFCLVYDSYCTRLLFMHDVCLFVTFVFYVHVVNCSFMCTIAHSQPYPSEAGAYYLIHTCVLLVQCVYNQQTLHVLNFKAGM